MAGDAWSPPTTSGPSSATSTATSSGSARPCSRRGTPTTTHFEHSAGASRPSWRCASDGAPATSRSRSSADGTTSTGWPRPAITDVDAVRARDRRLPPADARRASATAPRHELRTHRCRPPRAPRRSPSCAPPAGGRGPSRRSCAPTSSRASRRVATVLPGHRRLRGDGRPGDRERDPRRPGPRASSASAARPRRGWRGCSSACSTSGCRSSRGGELNDDPYAPVSPAARAIVERDGDATPIDWLPRDRRYAEKLATPDITIADLIGEVDPIKVAEGRYLSDELTLHYGLIPRANRGHRRDQRAARPRRADPGRPAQHPRGARRPDPRLHRPAAARPVRGRHRPTRRTTPSRGRIITPLKDRLGSQIRTHYPRTLEHEMAIVRQEKHRFEAEDGVPTVVVPPFMEELVAELTHLARRSPGDQPAVGRQRPGLGRQPGGARGGGAQAGRPARRDRSARRASRDLGAVVASTVGKVELETVGDEAPEERIVERLITKALYATFNRRVDARRPGRGRRGVRGRASSSRPASGRRRASTSPGCARCPGLAGRGRALGAFDVTDGAEEPAVVASAVEFLLEGLHLARRLNKERIAGGTVYHR